MMHASMRLNMLDHVMDYTEGKTAWSKEGWKKCTWEKGWELNDRRNATILRRHKDLNLYHLIEDKVTYLCLWELADLEPRYMYFCETMVKILSHAGKLKVDNFTLKAGPRSMRVCIHCQMSSLDDAYHMVLQCDETQNDRRDMFNEIYRAIGEEADILKGVDDVFPVLMGRLAEGLTEESLFKLRVTAGTYIHRMYQRRTRTESGIG